MNLKFPIILVLSLFIFTVSCKKNRNDEESGKLITHSLCKYDKQDVSDNNESCIEYEYNSEENKLNLKHINTAFNCCPDKLYCDINFSGDTIIIEEFERKQDCNCICLYDMEMEVYNVENKEYFIKVIEPYIGNQEKLLFEVDLSNNPSGSYCVERINYPWGI